MYKNLNPLATENEGHAPDSSNEINFYSRTPLVSPTNEVISSNPLTSKNNADFTPFNYKTPNKRSLSELKPFQIPTKTPIKPVYTGSTSTNTPLSKFLFSNTPSGAQTPQTSLLLSVQKLEVPPQINKTVHRLGVDAQNKNATRFRPSTAAIHKPAMKINKSTSVCSVIPFEKSSGDDMQTRSQGETLDFPILMTKHGDLQQTEQSQNEKNISHRSASEPKVQTTAHNSSFQRADSHSHELAENKIENPQQPAVFPRKSSRFGGMNELSRRNSTNDDFLSKLANMEVIRNANVQNQSKINFLGRSSSVSAHIQNFLTPHVKKTGERKLFSAKLLRPVQNQRIEESKEEKDTKSEKLERSQSVAQIQLIPLEESPSKKQVRISFASNTLEVPERISLKIPDCKTPSSPTRTSLAPSARSSQSPKRSHRMSTNRLSVKSTKRNKSVQNTPKQPVKVAHTFEDFISQSQVVLSEDELKLKQTDLKNGNQ